MTVSGISLYIDAYNYFSGFWLETFRTFNKVLLLLHCHVTSCYYRIPGNFYVGLFLRFGTKEDFTNLNFCEKASDQRKPHPCNMQLINPSPKAKGHAY